MNCLEIPTCPQMPVFRAFLASERIYTGITKLPILGLIDTLVHAEKRYDEKKWNIITCEATSLNTSLLYPLGHGDSLGARNYLC